MEQKFKDVIAEVKLVRLNDDEQYQNLISKSEYHLHKANFFMKLAQKHYNDNY